MTVLISTRNHALLLAMLGSLAACSRKQEQPAQPGPGTFANIDQLTDAEKRYGMAAARNPNVTLQPDVVLMPGGPKAVRAQGDNGFTWTITPMRRARTRSSQGRSCC